LSFDIEILVVNQTRPIGIQSQLGIQVLNEVDDETVVRFEKTWKFMSQTKGVWYSLVMDDNGILSAFPLCCSSFYSGPEDRTLPFWIDNDDVLYHLTPLLIRAEYRPEFERILTLLLEQSPTETVLFLARYQGGDYEIIQGTMPVDVFWVELDRKRILFNTCYVITRGNAMTDGSRTSASVVG